VFVGMMLLHMMLPFQEAFINISVSKIDKDYSLYRTYVIFRTLGLRHLVVVDVHNHVVGIITRKDLMPFNMEERLEKLLEHSTTLNPDAEFVLNSDMSKQSMDSEKGSCYDEKPVRLSDVLSIHSSLGDKSIKTFDAISNYSGDVLPAVTYRKTSTASKSTLYGHQERDEMYSTTSATEVEDSDPDHHDLGTPQIVVTISPPADDDAPDPETSP